MESLVTAIQAMLGVAAFMALIRALRGPNLVDRIGRIYGRKVEVFFVERLRDEERFPSTDDLRRQICLDVDRARAVLAGSGIEEKAKKGFTDVLFPYYSSRSERRNRRNKTEAYRD